MADGHPSSASEADSGRSSLSGVRILYALQPRDGGSVVHLTHLVRHAGQIGMDVSVICHPQIETLAELSRWAAVFPLAMSRWPGPGDMRALRHLHRLIKTLRPQIVHLHCAKAGALGRIAATIDPRVRIIYSPHHLSYRNPEFPSMVRGLFWLVERVLSRRTSAAVAVSPDVQTDLCSLCGRVPVVLIPNGVSFLRFDAMGEAAVPPGYRQAPVIGFLGSLRWRKGADLLVRAAGLLVPQLPDVTVRIAGDGPEMSRLQRLVDQLGVAGHVTFTGRVPDPLSFLQALDVVVIPSRCEAQSIVALEAMAAGKPVIATDVYGLRTVVRNGVDGLLVQPDSPYAIAEAILRLVRDPDLAARLGKAASERARVEFSLERMLRSHEHLYRWVLGQRDSSADGLPLSLCLGGGAP